MMPTFTVPENHRTYYYLYLKRGALLRHIIMVRHGQAQNNVERRLAGRMAGVGLTQAGVEQAGRAAAMLAEMGVSAVYSSPIARAADTARIISERCGVPVRVDERLTEIDTGKFTGMTFEEVASTHGDISAKFYGADVEIAHRGVETFEQVRRRISEMISHVVERHGGGGGTAAASPAGGPGAPAGNVVLVTHMDPIKAVLGMTVEISPERLLHMEVANASLNIFRAGRGAGGEEGGGGGGGLSLLALNVMDAARFATP